jgi:putative peptidoglycan lipid II flippase
MTHSASNPPSESPHGAEVERSAPPEGRFFSWLTFLSRPALAAYWPLLFYSTHGPEAPPLKAIMNSPAAKYQPDKFFHFAGYGVLTVLAVFAAFAGRGARFVTNLAVACVIVSVYAVVDEVTQTAFGRTCDGADVTADLLAVFAVCTSLYFMQRGREPLPRAMLGARLLLAAIVPLSGVMLFNHEVGLTVKIWKIVPEWMGYIRGDHVAHFVASFFLTLLIIAAAPLGLRFSALRNAAAALLLMFAAGPTIEWAQSFFGRGVEWEDVVAHSWGVIAAAALWGVWRTMVTLPVLLGVGRSREVMALEAANPENPPTGIDGLSDGGFDAGTDEPEEAERSQDGLSSMTGARDDSPRPKRPEQRLVGTPPGSALTQTPAAAHPHRFVGHAVVVGLMTLLSRFTGLVRDSILAAALGLSATADAFSIGFLIPNLFRRLFGEGALTAAFIPLYTDLVHKDRLTARRLASLCIAMMLVFLGGLTLLGELVLLAMLGARQWTAESSLAIELTMIMLPYMPMICIVALVGGILQVHGKFGAPAAAPIFLNVIMIIGTLVAVHITGGVQTDAQTTRAVTIISWTVLIAGLVQLIWQLGMVLRVERFTLAFSGARPVIRQMLALMVPMFVGLGVFQINTLVDYLIAFGLAGKAGGPEQLHLLGMKLDYPVNQGDVAALNWAQRLYQFPLGVFGIAVATAIFPALSRAAAAENVGRGQETGDRNAETDSRQAQQPQAPSPKPQAPLASFQSILHQGLRLTFFIGLPASAGLILLRVPITRLIYERGEFGVADSQRVAFVMIGYCAVIWAYSMTHVLTRAFYAMKDAQSPLRISMWMVLLNLALNVALVWPLGVAGLAWASAASAAAQVVMLVRALKRFVPQPVGPDVLRGWRMTGVLTALMTAVLLPVTLCFDAAAMTRTQSAVQLAILLPLGMAIVLVGAWLMKAEELSWLRRRR